MKHTPGPWERGPKRNQMSLMVYCDDSLGSRVADCSTSGHGISSEQDIANAKLIAAAPDMLVALEYLRRLADDTDCPPWLSSSIEAQVDPIMEKLK